MELDGLDNISKALSFCQHYLPEQGPLEYFVHHNTLHAFEDYDFFDALLYAKSLYGAKTHKSIYWYQRRFKEGRITEEDLGWSIEKNVSSEKIILSGVGVSKEELVKSLLFVKEDETAQFTLNEKKVCRYIENWSYEIPRKFRPVNDATSFVEETCSRSLSVLEDLELFSAKFFAAYFDKGVSYWKLEDREKGMLFCFYKLFRGTARFGWEKELSLLLKETDQIKTSPLLIIEKNLKEQGVRDQLHPNYLFHIIYRMKGWSALTLALENNEKYNPTKIESRFEEFAAVMSLLDLAIFRNLKKKYRLEGFEVDYKPYQNSVEKRIILRFLKKLKKLEVPVSLREKRKELNELYKEMNLIKLVKIWHEAYENKIVQSGLRQISKAEELQIKRKGTPSIQIVACIDDREESLRRYFEETDADCETFGYAGHYGLNIMFKGAHDVHYRPLCPVNAEPTHYVWEEKKEHRNKSLLSKAYFFFFHHSKIGLEAPLFSLLTGMLSVVPMLLGVVSPYRALIFKKKIKAFFLPSDEKNVKVNYESSPDRERRGYTVNEMAEVVGAMLKIIGLPSKFSPIFYIIGHGSESLNNPHKAAYNCGACSGGQGAANARVFAEMANRKDVRAALKEQDGIEIPDGCLFIGGYHNTCSDDLLYFNVSDDFKKTKAFREFLELIGKVQKKDAKERLRKFENVPLEFSEEQALRHAQGREATLAQPRPEYGHNANAVCVLGPRGLSRGIFWDRRAFLVSYDQERDQTNESLKALLNSIVPVCAGINLEYYFSFVDREIFGAGAKQPHNVTSIMGVSNGYRSDLRLGIPWQMVEIQEPSRIVIYIYTSEESFTDACKSSTSAQKLVEKEWVKIILVDKGNYYLYKDLNFSKIKMCSKNIFTAPSSQDYINGKRDILDFTVIEGGL